ncbi:uncharacterized protein LOC110096925 [Dendrobium catenatum]|uniref:SufE-like protein, chloroplastic n=1 Tax=Dendrobium catenatum TaxID=906689 RepID=A0A2I0XCL3_9ASPA|nr:uncharacterized protein LOC110096925 [Dendrobium catenatum]PKU85639.1 SufE-like protein, chloroplastic [Dendrobium catenatum]
MRAGFSLAMISSQSSLLPSMLRPANGIVLSSSYSSPVGRPWLLRPISFISDTAAGGPRAECKQLRWPRIIIAAPFFFPLPFRFPLLAGCGLRKFCSLRASQASDSSASIDSNTIQSMETKIKDQLNADVVIVKDAYGDGRHVSIDVVSEAFQGQSAVNRQRMVYKAIWEELQSTVHAVDQMTTRTPSEAAGNK